MTKTSVGDNKSQTGRQQTDQDDYNDKLIKLIEGYKERALNTYQFCQNRIEAIRGRLWTTLSWLATVQGGIMAFVFDKCNIHPTIAGGILHIKMNKETSVLALLLAIFGMLLSIYTIKIVNDGIKHMDENMERSDMALNMALNPEREKYTGDTSFKYIKFIAYITFFIQLLIFLAVVDRVFDIPFIISDD
jgi:hypothetical protein